MYVIDVQVIVFMSYRCKNISVLQGTTWVVVESPSPEVGAIHVAVGVNVVWAVTKDHKVRNESEMSH